MLIFLLFHPLLKSQHADSAGTGLNKKRAALVLGITTTAYVTGLSFLQFYWYRDYETIPFHLYNDNEGYLQMDKMGHGFSSYVITHIGYKSLCWSGATKTQALCYSGVLAFLYMTPIEVFDGLNEGYGFSSGDGAANTIGSLLFISQQALFNEQVVRPKFSYAESGYAKYRPLRLGTSPVETFFLDYNGHTYWLSANLKSITKSAWLPGWLNIAFGYSANGMLGEFSNPSFVSGKAVPDMQRCRQFLFSLDMDLSRIKTKSKFLKGAFGVLNFIKVPCPTIEYNGVEGIKMHGIYY